jgi:hypothetical protein
MTLNKLHKQLSKLIEQGYGRRQVAIAKESFHDNRESDGCTILPVCKVDTDWIVQADDDGGTAFNKDGTERGRWTVILGGSAYSSGGEEVR